LPLAGLSDATFADRIGELTREATAPLIANGIAADGIAIEHVALMRYAAQSDAMPVPFAMPLETATLEADFHRRHRELFGYATTEACVIESLRVQARKASSTPVARPDVGRPPRPERVRDCIFPGGEVVATPILARQLLSGTVQGPAIIEDAWSTVVVTPGWQARPDDAGNLFLTRSAA